jgi:hypothetical protein
MTPKLIEKLMLDAWRLGWLAANPGRPITATEILQRTDDINFAVKEALTHDADRVVTHG